jgi:hypothetical protein
LQTTQLTKLATEEMAELWQAAVNMPLHGPRCTCTGFGMMRRSKADLERDIVEFLISKYEDKYNDQVAHFLRRWLDEHASGGSDAGGGRSGFAGNVPAGIPKTENLLQWIDRNAPTCGASDEDLRAIGTDIRALLESMAQPSTTFSCV